MSGGGDSKEHARNIVELFAYSTLTTLLYHVPLGGGASAGLQSTPCSRKPWTGQLPSGPLVSRFAYGVCLRFFALLGWIHRVHNRLPPWTPASLVRASRGRVIFHGGGGRGGADFGSVCDFLALWDAAKGEGEVNGGVFRLWGGSCSGRFQRGSCFSRLALAVWCK